MTETALPADAPLEDLIARAAEMRVAGEKWHTIADALNRSVKTVEKWPKRNPDLWKKHFAKAESALMKDASSEAMHVLRQLMRSKNEKVRHDAAQKILLLRETRKKSNGKKDPTSGNPIPEVRQLVDYLEGMTHEQFYESFGIDPAAVAAGHAEPVGVDSPSADVAE